MSVAAAGLPTVLIVDDDENLLASVCRSLSGSFNLVKYIKQLLNGYPKIVRV